MTHDAQGQIQRLLEIMSRLRDPQSGCPWDRDQTFQTIAPYTVEEAFEVADAIGRNDVEDLRDELGDLLFQVVYHARMAEEKGWFDFAAVARTVCEKMIDRHPHVFGDETVTDAHHQTRVWEAGKAEERRQKRGDAGILADIPIGLPALMRAQKLQRRAARVGFDWPEISGVLDKTEEEFEELREALVHSRDRSRVEAELGDLLFSCCNLARHLNGDAETLLRDANRRFEARFAVMEREAAAGGQCLEELDSAALDILWERAKQQVG